MAESKLFFWFAENFHLQEKYNIEISKGAVNYFLKKLGFVFGKGQSDNKEWTDDRKKVLTSGLCRMSQTFYFVEQSK